MKIVRLPPHLEMIDEGHLEAALVEAYLTRPLSKGDDITWTGSGFLEWSPKTGFSINVLSKSNRGKYKCFSEMMEFTDPTSLIPAEHYCQMRAITQVGDSLSCVRIDPHATHIHSESDWIVWRLSNDNLLAPVEFVDANHDSFPPDTTAVLLKSEFRSWTHGEKIQATSIMGSGSQSRRNGVEFSPIFGSVKVVRLPSGHRLMTIKSTADRSRTVEAARMAVSLLAGVPAVWIASAFSQGSGLTTRISQRIYSPPKARLFEPDDRGRMSNAITVSLLEKAASYFATDEGQAVSNHINRCMDATENLLGTFALVLCSTVEGVMKHMLKLSSIKVESTLKQWEDCNLLGLTNGDSRIWGELRTWLAHGGLVVDEGPAMTLSKAHRLSVHVKSLLLRLIFACIDYSGDYIDPRTLSIATFPQTNLAELKQYARC